MRKDYKIAMQIVRDTLRSVRLCKTTPGDALPDAFAEYFAQKDVKFDIEEFLKGCRE